MKCSQCGDVGKDDPCNYCREYPQPKLEDGRCFVAILHDRGELSEVGGVFASESGARARVEAERPGLVWRQCDEDEGGGLSGYLDPEDEHDCRNMRAQVLPFELGP